MNRILLLIVIFISSSPLLADISISGGATYTYTSEFHAEPSYYEIKLYEMGLCTSEPTAPTSSSKLDTSNCQTVYSNAAGFDVKIQNGGKTDLSGTMTRPANGTYPYAYFRMHNNFIIEALLEFEGITVSDDSTPAGSGRYCATKTGTVSTTPGGTTVCSSTPPEVGKLTTVLQTFGDGFVDSVEVSGSYGTLKAYLINSSEYLASSKTDVIGLTGFQTLPGSIVVTDDTSSIDISFKVTQGMTVTLTGVSGENDKLDLFNGPLYINMTVK